jgi:hypothetical protein
MDDVTKGKLIDGAVVAAKATAVIGAQVLIGGALASLHPHAGARHFVRMTIPRPINMWRNQRNKRAREETLAACIADGHFTYGDYHITNNGGIGWAFIPLNAIPSDKKGPPINGGKWSEYFTTAEDCMRAIDSLPTE